MSTEIMELKAKVYDLQKENEETMKVLNKFAVDIAGVIGMSTEENFTVDSILETLAELVESKSACEIEEPEHHMNLPEAPMPQAAEVELLEG